MIKYFKNKKLEKLQQRKKTLERILMTCIINNYDVLNDMYEELNQIECKINNLIGGKE